MFAVQTQTDEDRVAVLPLSRIRKRPNYRAQGGEVVLSDEFVDSVRKKGVIQPVLVRPVGNQEYELVAGFKRYLAATICSLDTIPAKIKTIPDNKVLSFQLAENVQREDPNKWDTALGVAAVVKQLTDEGHAAPMTEAGRDLNKSRQWVSEHCAIAELPADVAVLVQEGKLLMLTKLRGIADITNMDHRAFVIQEAMAGRYKDALLKPTRKPRQPVERVADAVAEEAVQESRKEPRKRPVTFRLSGALAARHLLALALNGSVEALSDEDVAETLSRWTP